MTQALSIDHPLVAVRKLEDCRKVYQSLGFQLTPIGQHPWGTATSLILFQQQILEIVSIGDESLLDGYAAGNFKFGHHVQRHLLEREGVALTALYAADANAVQKMLASRAIQCEGTIEFGRDVIRPDGVADRTRTTLKVFPNKMASKLSVFACQQHRRDLLEFPELMQHPNGAHGLEAITVLCTNEHRAAAIDWFCSLHGSAGVESGPGETTIQTDNGVWRICDSAAVERRFGACDLSSVENVSPIIVGVDIRTSNLQLAHQYVNQLSAEVDDSLVMTDMVRLGGVMLRFVEMAEKPSPVQGYTG